MLNAQLDRIQEQVPPHAPPLLAEGAEIYGYVLRRRLGAGGFGEVWLAANSLDGAEVALKFPRLAADLSLDLLRREAGNYRRLVRAMVALPPAERPPIVAVLHDLTRHDPPALVMEYVSGGDLRTWFAARGGRALSFEESLPIVRDILAALVFAHAHNLVHRDLSPDNVLLDPASRRWKVADFGLGARHRATLPGEESDRNADRQLLSIARSGPVSADLSTLAAGKAHYMAPEQELGGRVGPAADIYALGVIWAQLLMGDLSSGLPATWYPRVPEAARPLLLQCLETDPQQRGAALAAINVVLARSLESAAGERASRKQLARDGHARGVPDTPRPQGKAAGRRKMGEGLPTRPPEEPPHSTDPGQQAGERLVLTIAPGVEMALRWIPPGTFTMGSPEPRVLKEGFLGFGRVVTGGEDGRHDDEGPQTRVTLTSGFWMGETEVTQRQYEAIAGTNPSYFKGADLPVEQVSWNDATEFCRQLSERTRLRVRLPTEAEWEYACRAGTTTRWHFGDDQSRLGSYAWFSGNAGGNTHPVGTKQPNVWGLHDMHGNVWEWCSSWYGARLAGSSAKDPSGPARGKYRVNRGGSWNYFPEWLRSAFRNWDTPRLRYFNVGFRVVISPTS